MQSDKHVWLAYILETLHYVSTYRNINTTCNFENALLIKFIILLDNSVNRNSSHFILYCKQNPLHSATSTERKLKRSYTLKKVGKKLWESEKKTSTSKLRQCQKR